MVKGWLLALHSCHFNQVQNQLFIVWHHDHHCFSGQFCEDDIDECQYHNCHHGATCNNLYGTYECICPEGYDGRDCTNNIDDCASGKWRAWPVRVADGVDFQKWAFYSLHKTSFKMMYHKCWLFCTQAFQWYFSWQAGVFHWISLRSPCNVF